VVLLVTALLAFGPGICTSPQAQARDISGNTYTSPQFGFSVTWDDTWLVMSETSEAEFDSLLLTNGLANVAFLGLQLPGGSGQLAATSYASAVRLQEGVSDYTILESGGDESRYYVTLSMTVTYEDGSSAPLIEYIEARTVTPGSTVVVIDSYGFAETFELAKPLIEELLTGLVIPGDAPSGDQPAPNETPADETVVVLEKGEPGPVFMAGPWRIAIVAAAQNVAIPGLGLDEKDGKEWVAVVADVTNWGSSDPAFPAEDVFIQMAESSSQHSVATGSTTSAARTLEIPAGTDTEIAYGETGRLVLVFSVNADRVAPSLIYRQESLPLDELLLVDIDPAELRAPAGPPDLQEATLVMVSADGETLQAQYAGESLAHRLRLLGIDASESPQAVIDALMVFEGETVWIEMDSALDETATPNVYLWIENERGDRVLLNQALIESGAAQLNSLPGEARFALWLESTADQQQ
jgi:hypothetical protein